MLFNVVVKGHTAVQIWAIVIKMWTDFITFFLLFYFCGGGGASSFPSSSLLPHLHSNPNHQTDKQIRPKLKEVTYDTPLQILQKWHDDSKLLVNKWKTGVFPDIIS